MPLGLALLCWPGTFKELLGESLFLQEGDDHRRHRKLLMPAFHGPALAVYVDTMQTLTEWFMKLVVAHLLRHYTWELLPGQNLDMNPVATLRPRSGLKVVFKRDH